MSTQNLPVAGSHSVPLHYAIQLTSRYRNNRELILDPDFKNRNILPLSETFNKSDILILLEHPESAGLRIYPGMDQENKVHAVLVAVNENNEDLLPNAGMLTDDDPVIIQEGQRCPVICPPDSPLNS